LRRVVVLVALAVVLLAAGPAAGRDRSTCANHPQRAVRACLWHAAKDHHVSYGLLRAIAWCESGLNPFAFYGHPLNDRPEPSVFDTNTSAGLLGFKPSTYGITPYRHRSIWRARWSARAGGWLLAHQGTTPWAASRHCWGMSYG
jgi:hypothetical protein